jgi:hypothetical protein
MLLSRRSDHVTLLVKDQSPRTAGSNVNAESKNGRPLSSLNVEYKRELRVNESPIVNRARSKSPRKMWRFALRRNSCRDSRPRLSCRAKLRALYI